MAILGLILFHEEEAPLELFASAVNKNIESLV